MRESIYWRDHLEILRGLSGRKKWEHIWEYYKWAIILIGIAVFLVFYVVFRLATYREPVLYVAFVNVSAGDEVTEKLTDDFLPFAGFDKRRERVGVYRNLPITESMEVDRQMVYAAEMKLLSVINGKQLDVVLMDGAAREIFERNGYLLGLGKLIPELGDGCSLDISDTPLIRDAGFSGNIYLGVIANCPRLDAAEKYLMYITGE